MDIANMGNTLNNLFKRVVGMGDKTYFWKDIWCGDLALKDLCPNLYYLEINTYFLVM